MTNRGMRRLQAELFDKCGLPYSMSADVIKTIVNAITADLQQGRPVTVAGLGRFSLRHVAWYVTQGKLKRGPVVVRVHPEADYPKFTPSPTLRKNIWRVRKPDYKETKPIIK